MELHRLESCDSTSAVARALLAKGARPPFAVVAERQTHGRGRRGHAWESPPGNLYVTFALPPEAAAARDQGLVPLKAAVVTARALRRTTGLRLTLKWPNDLLFAGRKVGGLLCETSQTGDLAGEILVGLGLNVAVAPDLGPPDPAEPFRPVPLALAEALRRPIALDELREPFLAAFEAAWAELPLGGAVAAFRALATGDGQPWEDRDDRARYWREAPLEAAGDLRLVAMGARAEELRLTSAEHRCAWAYQAGGRERHPLFVADCGNTRIKLARFQTASSERPAELSALATEGESEALAEVLRGFAAAAPTRGWPLFSLAVNPEAEARLAAAAEAAGLALVPIPKRPVRVHGDRYALDQLGADRLAALEGALAATGGGDGWLVVCSLGTAMTVDVARRDGWHAGGYIVPGLALGLAALHEGTHLLPRLDPAALADFGASETPFGIDTRSAMLGGALAHARGLVLDVLATLGDASEPPLVLLTGGDAARVAPSIEAVARASAAVRVAPDLVVQGARILALGGVV